LFLDIWTLPHLQRTSYQIMAYDASFHNNLDSLWPKWWCSA
jgi:hypothetical protein